MKTLLIVAHTPSNNTSQLAAGMLEAAQCADIGDIDARIQSPFETHHQHLSTADGVLLFTTENFGYMSGALKDMFDRTYYDCLEETQGLPWCLCVRAGRDGTGTVRAVESIATGLAWKSCQAPLVLKGDFQQKFFEQSQEFSMTFAAGLAAGIY